MSGRTGMLGVQERSTTTILLSRKIPRIKRWPDWEALRALRDGVHEFNMTKSGRTE